MNVRFWSKLAIGMLSVAFYAASAEADVICRGPVNSVGVLPNGAVQVDWGFGGIYVCWAGANSPSPTDVVAKETCSVITSQAMTSLSTGKDFGAYFGGISSCANIRNNGNGWGNPQPSEFFLFRY